MENIKKLNEIKFIVYSSVAGRYRSGQPEHAWGAHYPLLWLKYHGGAVEKQPTSWCSGCILACQLSGLGLIPRGVLTFPGPVTSALPISCPLLLKFLDPSLPIIHKRCHSRDVIDTPRIDTPTFLQSRLSHRQKHYIHSSLIYLF